MEGTAQPGQEIIDNSHNRRVEETTSDENVVSSETIRNYAKVMEEVVNVNSLFTFGVFIGLSSFASRDQSNLQIRPECAAGVSAARRLVVFEVLSFSFFIYSSLVAKSANFLLNLYREEELRIYVKYRPKLFRKWILDYSGWTSVASFIFLLLSMVELVQIRLGKLSCGSRFSLGAALSLIIISTSALCIYIFFIILRVAWKSEEDLKMFIRR